MNKRMIIKMCINPHIIKTFLNLHCQFRKHEDYKVRNMVKCGLNIIINDHLVQHDGYYLVNSFIPPINTEAFRTVVKMVPGKGKNFLLITLKGFGWLRFLHILLLQINVCTIAGIAVHLSL